MRTPAIAAAVAVTSIVVAACGSGDSARDDALAALDRATDAAGLEAEMAALVGDLPDAPSPEETDEATEAIADLDDRAGDVIASADTGNDYDERIRSSAEEIRGAGDDLTGGLDDPAALGPAKVTAVGRLQDSNQSLTTAAEEIGGELEDDEGNLSAEDADALEATLTEIEASGEAVAQAQASIGGSGTAEDLDEDTTATGQPGVCPAGTTTSEGSGGVFCNLPDGSQCRPYPAAELTPAEEVPEGVSNADLPQHGINSQRIGTPCAGF